MKAKIMKITGFLAVATILLLGLMAFARPEPVYASSLDRRGGPGGNGGGGGVALTPLTDSEKAALNQAILEEYGALNLYQSVIDQFGDAYPFSQIVRAEQQHVNALVRQATKYGVAVPANPGLKTTPSFDTLAEACQAGVEAEKADAALYDRLEPLVTHTDILNVFNNLQSASLNSHLPAFQTCQ